MDGRQQLCTSTSQWQASGVLTQVAGPAGPASRVAHPVLEDIQDATPSVSAGAGDAHAWKGRLEVFWWKRHHENLSLLDAAGRYHNFDRSIPEPHHEFVLSGEGDHHAGRRGVSGV